MEASEIINSIAREMVLEGRIAKLEATHDDRYEPCKHGHPMCAIVDGGACYDEQMTALESRKLVLTGGPNWEQR